MTSMEKFKKTQIFQKGQMLSRLKRMQAQLKDDEQWQDKFKKNDIAELETDKQEAFKIRQKSMIVAGH